MTQSHKPMNVFFYGQLICLLLSIMVIVLYRFNTIGFKSFSVYFGVLLLSWIALGLTVFFLIYLDIVKSGLPLALSRHGYSGVLALLPIGLLTVMFIKAYSVPPIHDISTDTTNPPEFSKAPRLRKSSDNKLDYNDRVKNYQIKAYPEIKTLLLSQPPDQVFSKALRQARSMAWKIHHMDKTNGIIEASVTTPVFGFTDDVVIRIRSSDEGQTSLVDLRSASRVGVSDLGANANRIKNFIEKMRLD